MNRLLSKLVGGAAAAATRVNCSSARDHVVRSSSIQRAYALRGKAMNEVVGAALATACLLGSAPADASVLVDNLPTPLQNGYDHAESDPASSNIMVKFTLAEAASVNGLTIVTLADTPGLQGLGITVKLAMDANGSPGQVSSFAETFDTIADFRPGYALATTHFAPLQLTAGSHWFGISAPNHGLRWSTFVSGMQPKAFFNGSALVFVAQGYQLGFRVLGADPQPLTPGIPEPGTWALLILGFGSAGAMLRRQRLATAG